VANCADFLPELASEGLADSKPKAAFVRTTVARNAQFQWQSTFTGAEYTEYRRR